MSDMIMPPHPGLDKLTNIEELKHLCPAFSKGCPYAQIEEVNTITVSRGELTRCPAFQDGCPFSTKNEEEVLRLMAEIPDDHPTLNMSELPSCDEGFNIVKMLNKYLDQPQLQALFDIKLNGSLKMIKDIKVSQHVVSVPELEYLEDPQLASAMREGTKVVHKAAESSVFTKRFLKGDINADEYGRYINSLYFVYKCMEELLDDCKEHPAVKPIHFPLELNRTESLLQDLEFFYGKRVMMDLIQPDTMTPAVQKYIHAMKAACVKTPALLVAHSYSRYLGDLSGGQILAKRLKKHVLNLEEHDSAWDTTDGLNFYYFNNLGNQADFKSLYRERLNTARVDEFTRDLLVEEAIRSFELNIELFDEIQQLSEEGRLIHSLIQKKPRVVSSNKQDEKVSWVSAVSAAVSLITVGAVVYQRYKK